jgi:hypothetical protein
MRSARSPPLLIFSIFLLIQEVRLIERYQPDLSCFRDPRFCRGNVKKGTESMNMKLLKDDFLISVENQQKALEAIQHAVRTRSWVVDTEGDQKQVEFLRLSSVDNILAATSLAEVFVLFGWRLISQGRTVYGITLCEEVGKYTPDYEIFFALVAPFVEIGCIEVEGVGTDGYMHWQWQFTGVRCRSILEGDENWNVLPDERLFPETLPECKLQIKVELSGKVTIRSHDSMQAREQVRTLIEMALNQLEALSTVDITSLDVSERE